MKATDRSLELTLGAIVDGTGTTFRVWAPAAETIVLRLWDGTDERSVQLSREGAYATARVPGLGAGARYAYLVNGAERPDPCSRSQPDGVHASSEVADPRAFKWTDDAFVAPEAADLVIYECHIGTFTEAGSFDGAIDQLSRLSHLGVNAIELMPVASFAGHRNWGYDGVALFAPHAGYGGPEGLRRFVDAAHAGGIAVILDVVYNHFGPAGNYTAAYSKEYLTDRHQTPWGDAVNLNGPGSIEVRRFIKENLLHWVREYHIDGFRFDAAHAIRDESRPHIFAEIAGLFANPAQHPYLIAESNENDARYVRPIGDGGWGFDAVWADDFHHITRNLFHPERDGYLASYRGTMGELADSVVHGWHYRGQPDLVTGIPRGTETGGIPPSRFVFAMQNHDQIGNRPFGLRASTTMTFSDYLALSGLLLLAPETPLIFQGQEFFAATPFCYFTDHGGELGKAITAGRRSEFQFPGAATAADLVPDPEDEATFEISRLRLDELRSTAGRLCQAFYRACLDLRASDAVLCEARRGHASVAAQVCRTAAVFQVTTGLSRRLLVFNAGAAQRIPIAGAGLEGILCSTELRFGGSGIRPEFEVESLFVPGHSFALLSPVQR